MDMKEIKISSKVIYDGKVLKLELDDVKCPNGIESKREIVRHNGGSAVLCITKDNQVMLVKQFRYAYDETVYEIPAGKLEKGEDPYDAALREFEEETGSKTDKLEFLNVIYPSCGYTSEKIYLYLASNFEVTQTHFDEDEFIETYFFPLEKVLEMIKSNEIKDAKTICAINSYLLAKNKINL